ncbi:hypothetical protein OS493_027937 [Desmophyllum pertusum]|uniref:Apple domain-containing protein n=1 Tax=Desmophyllum pertusum TaxID=174260 RepID=A0A9W9YKT2_9CNID|nr:hypothetical protein OS493_027937 [Desmophyllum pertusum]
MKDLECVLYFAILLGVVGEKISCGSKLAIQRHENNRFAVFRKVKEGKALEGHVITTYLVYSELDCLQKCLLCDKCVSFNVQLLSSGSRRHACELNDVTRLSSGHALTFRDGFSYNEPIMLPNEEQDNPQGRHFPAVSPAQG